LLNLDVRGLTKLEYLDFAGNFANNIKLGNNPKLDRLDLAENDIGKLNFPPLPSLTELSLRENLYSFGLRKGWEQPTETVIIRSPKLKFLDYNGYSNIKDFEIHKDYPLENPNQLMVCHDKTYQNEDASTE
jgi:hypothetical protein